MCWRHDGEREDRNRFSHKDTHEFQTRKESGSIFQEAMTYSRTHDADAGLRPGPRVYCATASITCNTKAKQKCGNRYVSYLSARKSFNIYFF